MSKQSETLEAAAATFVSSPTAETFEGLAQAAREFVASEVHSRDVEDTTRAAKPSNGAPGPRSNVTPELLEEPKEEPAKKPAKKKSSHKGGSKR